ncbi:MAG TPA: transglycosylase SLT domain-containing protein [Candidatus Binataceae bacterium]|nr:transglycosylase SLT domain-containing protein [Candidatus Binataceae bacterium]
MGPRRLCSRFLLAALVWPMMLSVPLTANASALFTFSPALSQDSLLQARAPSSDTKASLQLAQFLPFERNKVQSLDPRQAFVEGYQDYNRGDWIATIERMQLVASGAPELADYALYYQASAERQNGDPSAAAADFSRLATAYPLSIWASDARLGYAQIELAAGRPDLALNAAQEVSSRSPPPEADQQARILIAQALQAQGNSRGAYAAAQELRQRYPQSAADAAARALAYQILAANPAFADTESLSYQRSEAVLLLREGQASLALERIDDALAMNPPLSIRAELFWLKARAAHANPPSERAALTQYLTLAPQGVHAAGAISVIAHSWWRSGDTDQARAFFARLVRQFPSDNLAPEAMFDIGRTYEDDGEYASARSAYHQMVALYPHSETAVDGRFRAAFMLYMLKQYDQAASEFALGESQYIAPSDRDMFAYWKARSLEQNGERARAQAEFIQLAQSTLSNYYPALAATRIQPVSVTLPAASVPDPVAYDAPTVPDPAAQFHLTRVVTFRALGLRELEAPELRALADYAAANPSLRQFMLAEYGAAGAWYDGIVAATKLSARGEIDQPIAERMRYPRAYWNLIASSAERTSLDPFLVLSLTRQESLFNPNARSGSDARGLMQLLPATAQRWAPDAGLAPANLDLYQPDTNVAVGTTYLKNLFAMFNGNAFKAVAAYNGGEHAVAGWSAKYPGDDDQWVENIGYRETRDYVKKVVGGLREYRLLYPAAAPASSSPPTAPGTVPRASGVSLLPPAPASL